MDRPGWLLAGGRSCPWFTELTGEGALLCHLQGASSVDSPMPWSC